MIIETTAPPAVGLPLMPSSLICNEQHSKSQCQLGKFSDSAQVLPIALEELGSETTSLDPYAYIWDYPDNCVLSVLRTEEVNMVKQGAKYYIISEPDSTTKFVFEVKNDAQKHCGKATDIYPTNYD